jgi:Flp pilus assembly protein TadG
VIALLAAAMLLVIGAMAALSIDVVTFYTARSETQLAADSAALAAARVLANSGATSDPNSINDGLMTSAWGIAEAVALQVAEQNPVGGTNLAAANVIFPAAPGGTSTNPTVTITVQVPNLPTFFARIWGTKFVAVSASATAEVYNPSGAHLTGSTIPVAPMCVKPWLLPNIDPSSPPNPIFATTNGAINDPALLGWTSSPTGVPMSLACPGGNCSGLPPPVAWQYYPGDPATTFPPPTQAIPTCAPAMTTQYEKSIAGCIETPIACNSTANVDTSNYGNNRNRETERAVNCLTHANTNQGDQVDPAYASAPFEFLAGNDNPIAGLAGKDVMVSDSLVTVPVFDVNSFNTSGTNFPIVGFVQLFLNPNGMAAPGFGPNRGKVNTTIINMAGCGTGASGTPILGNGASPVAVRLISP